MTLHALAEARAAGAWTAVLQAAPGGVGVYRRAGFEAFGRVVEYKPGPEVRSGVSPLLESA